LITENTGTSLGPSAMWIMLRIGIRRSSLLIYASTSACDSRLPLY